MGILKHAAQVPVIGNSLNIFLVFLNTTLLTFVAVFPFVTGGGALAVNVHPKVAAGTRETPPISRLGQLLGSYLVYFPVFYDKKIVH